MTKRSQFHRHLRNDILPTDRGEPSQPTTEQGKQHSRCNAVRHGLTAETVIRALQDAEDYRAFEATITADYDAQSAVERELVLRLASLLWRLRRAATMETGLFEIQAEHLSGLGFYNLVQPASRQMLYALFEPHAVIGHDAVPASANPFAIRNVDLARSPQLRARSSQPL
jgi:hypothetical protein